ncbi:outer membrane cobalamin receptor protein [Caulobacter sp. AP07]|uniref:TonB-dependent receptor n=1 Tax=Caulobacter sp. AP07 TaxID=1144304 RepID=UPI000271ED4C|nr:TonB-dependent receptor [Caulobacter sp. AP07]EJL37546.1 outer membrane cobalamin receptor protein [Caulobacter sp. AP07]
MFSISTRRRLLASAAILVLTLAGQAAAQSAPNQSPSGQIAATQTRSAPARPAQTYDLKPQDLGQALSAVAQASGREVIAPQTLVSGRTAPALQGRYTADQAFERLLANTGLALTPVGDKLVLRQAPAGPAPGEPQAGDAETLSELVVTGTRIRGAGPVGANLISITRREIETSGYGTTQQIVQAIPQNFGGGPNEATLGYNNRNGAYNNAGLGASINLRGLGANSTLVLLNGARPALGGVAGLFTDVSLIPASALDHVEVLADGASALYGSDAVGGVVNLVMRDRFEGLETRLRLGTADGDAQEGQAGAIWGKTWDGGHVTLAYEYYQRGRLSANDRPFATEDLRAFGGADNRQPFGAPGNIFAGGQYYAIPSGQNGVGLTVGQLKSGQTNRSDQQRDTDLLPRQRRHVVYGSARQALDARTEVFGQLLAADRRFNRRYIGSLERTTSVPVTNPFYLDVLGTHQPVSVRYDFRGDLGKPVNSGGARAVNATAGVTRSLADWSATLQGGYGRQRETWRNDNTINSLRLRAALADPNRATAYNVFGDPGSTPRATIDTIRGYDTGQGVYTVWSASLRADGPLLDLPAGPLKAAVGAEWRAERYRQSTVTDLTTAGPVAAQTLFPGRRRIAAAYVEARALLLSPSAPIGQLDLALAGRVERYSDVGTTRNPKIGLDWRPLSSLTLKGSYGKSFRAPSFQDLQVGPGLTFYQPVALPDPASPTGSTPVLALVGNSPDTGPERATTWSGTIEYRPPAIDGLKLTASYFKVAYRDRIANVNANAFNLLIERAVYAGVITDNPPADVVARYYAAPELTNPSAIPAAAIKAIVDLRNRNLSQVDEDGVDFDLDYRRPVGAGEIGLGLGGSYIFSVDQRVTDASPSVDVVGTVGNPNSLRLRGRLNWTQGAWSTTVAVNHIDGYRNQIPIPARAVKAWTTADLQLAWLAPKDAGRLAGLKVALSVSNLFDRDPPFAEIRSVTSAVGYDGEKASPVGRLVALELVRAW